MTDRASWQGRAVTFADFSVGEGDTIIDAFAQSSRHGSRVLLVHALRYADTGEPVFASVAEIEAQPFRHFEQLTYLSARCSFANGFGNDPDAPPPAENGHDNGGLLHPSL